MEPRDGVAESYANKVLEEIGLEVELCRFTGVYSTTNRIATYKDANLY